jgi:hypothetical protein
MLEFLSLLVTSTLASDCRQGQELTLDWSTWKVLQSGSMNILKGLIMNNKKYNLLKL